MIIHIIQFSSFCLIFEILRRAEIILKRLNNFHDESIELSTDIMEKDKNEEKTGF